MDAILMDTGPIIFILVGIGIIAAGLWLPRHWK
jgi:hypothetical protein